MAKVVPETKKKDINGEEEIFEGIMEIIPPELMEDKRPQVERNHQEQKRRDKENYTLRHKLH